MIENWIRWEPIRGLSAKYYIESISDSIEGFQILLVDAKDENKKTQIIFEDSVDSYKRTDETFKHKLVCDLHEKFGRNFYGDWTFFKVTNSSYIQLLSEESYGISDSRPLIHFSLLGADSVVDIICDYEPKILLIKGN
jgi:hypothetical protein